MKRQVHPPTNHGTMEMITNVLRGIIRRVRLLGSPRCISGPAREASFITNSRRDAMRQGVTSPIIVRYTFRIRLCPTTPDYFLNKTRN